MSRKGPFPDHPSRWLRPSPIAAVRSRRWHRFRLASVVFWKAPLRRRPFPDPMGSPMASYSSFWSLNIYNPICFFISPYVVWGPKGLVLGLWTHGTQQLARGSYNLFVLKDFRYLKWRIIPFGNWFLTVVSKSLK